MSESKNTKIKACTCKHAFQDRRYGKGMRLHNRKKGKNSVDEWACTVCSPMFYGDTKVNFSGQAK